ncbi:MAG: restriction endonuclease, partial [Sphingobacterium sp.]
MNTVLKGNQFEDKVFDILQDEVEKGTIPLLLQCCKFQRKPKYYSKDREKPIEFDISIEVTPIGAENYQLLYIAECKNYSGKISIDNVEEFVEKVNQVSGKNVKAVFVFSGELQSGVQTYAKNKGVMLINVTEDNLTNIILHNKKNNYKIKQTWTESIDNYNNDLIADSSNIDKQKWDEIIERAFTISLGKTTEKSEPNSSLSQ